MVAMFSGFPKHKGGKNYHWRLRKTRKDAGKAKTPAQKKFREAAKTCEYPKKGTATQRRARFNACICRKLGGTECGK